MEYIVRSRSLTKSLALIMDIPLPDVFSILNDLNQNNLDTQCLKLVNEIKKISEFQKESVQDVIEKSQAMIADLIWQRDQLINRIKEECSIKAFELREIIQSLQKSGTERRGSHILKPSYSQPLLEFDREICYFKLNWLKKNSFSVKFTENGLEKVRSSAEIMNHVLSLYENIENCVECTQLLLSRKIGDDGARHLSHVLPFYVNLTVLTLTSNCIGPRGGRFIASCLPYLKKLYKLYINNDRVKDAVLSIARALPFLVHLEELYLSTGVFYEREVGDLALSLSLIPRLKNLSILGGILEAKGTEKLCQGLIFLTSLKTLDLSGNSIGQGGAEYLSLSLSSLKNLESLKLAANNFPSTSGECIGQLISNLPKLEELYLNSNTLGDQGVCEMVNQGMLNLKMLHLQDNGIGNIGGKVLIQKCAEWKRLELLDLSWNCLDQSIFNVFHGNEERYKLIKVELYGMNLILNGFSGFNFNV